MGKVEIGIYCCLTADILTNVLHKCSCSSSLPTFWFFPNNWIWLVEVTERLNLPKNIQKSSSQVPYGMKKKFLKTYNRKSRNWLSFLSCCRCFEWQKFLFASMATERLKCILKGLEPFTQASVAHGPLVFSSGTKVYFFRFFKRSNRINGTLLKICTKHSSSQDCF